MSRSEEPAHRTSRVADLMESSFLFVAVAFAAYLLFHLTLFPYGRDQAIFSTVAKEILAGSTLYRDITDVKPPGTYLLYAAVHATLGPSQGSVRVFETLAVLSTLIPFVALSRRYVGSRRAGVVAWAIAVFAHVRSEYWNTAQSESFGSIALVWAFMLLDPEQDGRSRRRTLWRWSAAGVLFSWAGLLKPVMGVVALVPWLFLAKRHGLRAAFRPGICLLVGGLLFPLLVILQLAANGALDDMFEVMFVTVPRYTSTHFRPEWLLGYSYAAVTQWLKNYSPYFLPGLALLLALPAPTARAREGQWLFAAVVGVLLVGVAAQAKFFAYHFAAAHPFGSLLAGWGIWRAWVRLRPRPFVLLAFAAALVAIHDVESALSGEMERFWTRCRARIEALRHPERRDAIFDRLYSVPDMDRRAIREVADWIASTTSADATVFLWGSDPLIYVLADRRPATRFVTNILTRAAGENSPEFAVTMAELASQRPSVVIVQAGDRLPVVVGHSEDSVTTFQKWKSLHDFVVATYEPGKSFEKFLVLRRIGSATQ